METTKIEWTATVDANGVKHAGATFNPWWGCTKITDGCTNCYADTFAKRVGHGKRLPMIWGPRAERKPASESMWRQPAKWDREAKSLGIRRKVFCASMADVFEDRPDLAEHRVRLFRVIESTPNLDWLLLTKRPENMVTMSRAAGWDAWPSNVWAGTTCEDQRRANERIPHLIEVPARVRFISYEPAIEGVDFSRWIAQRSICTTCWNEKDGFVEDPCREPGCTGTFITTWGDDQAERLRTGERYEDHRIGPNADLLDNGPPLHWIIVGGESGPGARPFDVAWARSTIEQCRDADVACFVKQLGAKPYDGERAEPTGAMRTHNGRRQMQISAPRIAIADAKGGDWTEWPDDLRVREWPQ